MCAQHIPWAKYLRKNPSSRISKSQSPIRRIVRVEETSNSPLKARGLQRKRVIIKGRNGTGEGIWTRHFRLLRVI